MKLTTTPSASGLSGPLPLPDGVAGGRLPPCAVSAAPFLGVARSASGRLWRLRPGDDRMALALGQRYDLPDIVARVLTSRNVPLDGVPAFLDPRLRDTLPDPASFRDMAPALDRLAQAVMAGEGIGVFGDYDVDGATSSALLIRYFRALGIPVQCHIPDRIDEGYGPNAAALLELAARTGGLIVTADCGTTAHEPLAAARAAGVDVVVIDHHAGEERLPPAVAVVNPNRLDETSPHGHLAAVGVTFLVLVGLNRRLREVGLFATRPEPDLMRWLDLVALGTVCDVVPLVGVNRAFVTQGLKVLAKRGNTGLRVLADLCRLGEEPSTYHLGFVLGPRINAGGRVGKADLGVRLLVSEDEREAGEIALQLDALNRDRQLLEAQVLEESCARLGDGSGDPAILVAGENWHPGVIGIVASRLRERFNRPACVVSFSGDEGSGSGRSIAGVDLGDLVIAARQTGILTRGGGHAMAAGFTVTRGSLDRFRAFLFERVAARVAVGGLVPTLELDGALRLGGVNEQILRALEQIGPFGSGNAEPLFGVPEVRVQWSNIVGEKHVRCVLADATGARLEAIAFRAAENALGALLLRARDIPIHVAGRLRFNTWKGTRSIQFQIDDAAPA